jgi:hypothetical protein
MIGPAGLFSCRPFLYFRGLEKHFFADRFGTKKTDFSACQVDRPDIHFIQFFAEKFNLLNGPMQRLAASCLIFIRLVVVFLWHRV